MALNVTLTAGILPQPACYATEQDRFNAYVAAIIVAVTGGIQWVTEQDAPADKSTYWLRTDSGGIPIGAYVWETADGAWVPWVQEVVNGTGAGTANAFTVTDIPPLPPGALFTIGRILTFISNQTNSGASTLAVDGGVTKTIKKAGTADLEAGDIVTGQMVIVIWDGANWQIQNPIKPQPGTEPAVYVSALLPFLSNNTTSSPLIHGLTVNGVPTAPYFIRVVFVCITPEGGYSVGDELDASGVFASNDDSHSDTEELFAQMLKWVADTTTITVICYYPTGDPASTPRPPQKNALNFFTFTPANWNIKVYAYIPPSS